MAGLNLIAAVNWEYDKFLGSNDYPIIMAHVSDANGVPVTGLTTLDFAVWEGSYGLYPIKVEEVSSEYGPAGTYFIHFKKPSLLTYLGRYVFIIVVYKLRVKHIFPPDEYDRGYATAVFVRAMT